MSIEKAVDNRLKCDECQERIFKGQTYIVKGKSSNHWGQRIFIKFCSRCLLKAVSMIDKEEMKKLVVKSV